MTFVVGVTGNIASGKSTVSARFAHHGATLVDADALARAAVTPGTETLAAIGARWPSVIRGGALDRVALRRIVFENRDERDALNAIVHPAVGRLRDAALAAARERGDRVVVYDVPLLFEARLEHTVDAIVLVDASEHVRRGRLLHRGLTPADADAAMAAQMPSDVKRARSHYVIDNNEDLVSLIERTDQVWHALARRAEVG